MARLFREERHFLDTEKTDGGYYIALCEYYPDYNYIMLLTAISANSFMKYPFLVIKKYLRMYSVMKVRDTKVNIVKLNIIPHDEVYRVVIKTYWIRIVQRHWRRVYREKTDWSIRDLYMSMLKGGKIAGKPGLRGMLSVYGKSRPLMERHQI